MNIDSILPYLVTIVTNIVTWTVARRKRDNDFLAELQRSIDLLSEKYNRALQELVEVKEQNVKLLTSQAVLQSKVEYLTAENKALNEQISELNSKLENVKTITRSK